MKLLLISPLMSLVVSVTNSHIKRTDANGSLHVHLNVADQGPVEHVHVHLNKLTQPRQNFTGKTGNRIGKKNRAGYSLSYNVKLHSELNFTWSETE